MPAEQHNETEFNINQEENLIFEKLKQSGEMDRLKELLKLRLEENGWKDKVSEAFKKTMEERELGELSVPGIVHDLLPIARSEIPSNVKLEIVQQINSFLSKDLDYSDMYNNYNLQPATPPKK